MSYMKLKALKVGLAKNGNNIAIGEEFETDPVSGASLVEDGYAKKLYLVEDDLSDFTGEGKQIHAEGLEGGKTEPGQSVEGQNVDQEGEGREPDTEKVVKALDAQYKRDEIYEAAKAAGVEIAYNAKKADIVAAVIAHGKAEALLK